MTGANADNICFVLAAAAGYQSVVVALCVRSAISMSQRQNPSFELIGTLIHCTWCAGSSCDNSEQRLRRSHIHLPELPDSFNDCQGLRVLQL